MVSSKGKGNKYENKIFKELREIIPEIHKTLGSGSSEDDADLVCDEYVIEIKHHKKLEENQIDRFFSKVFKQAVKRGKTPVLIYKENYKPAKAMTFMHMKDNTVIGTIDYEEFKVVARCQKK
jgi:hypothetical protein